MKKENCNCEIYPFPHRANSCDKKRDKEIREGSQDECNIEEMISDSERMRG